MVRGAALSRWWWSIGLLGCQTPWVEANEGSLRLLQASLQSSYSGALRVEVDVLPGEEALLATVVVDPEELIYFSRVIAPDGEVVFEASEYWESPRSRTYGAFSADVVSLNWPINDQDRDLEPGRWRLHLQMGAARAPVEMAVALKTHDVRSGQGELKVNLLITQDLADDTELLRGTNAAVAWWQQQIYGPLGVDVQVQSSAWTGESALLPPGRGDQATYLALAEAKALDEVNVVMLDRLLDVDDVLGVAGSIPGALVPTGISAVAVSALEASGSNRTFSRAEERLLGETLAHEVGHYLGLFHPVELVVDAPAPESWDGLDDTLECTTFAQCEAELATNLMYASPVCATGAGAACVSFVGQTELTDDQTASAYRFVGVK